MTETSIEWTDCSWNPITGCKPLSSGCANCYAAHLAGTRLAQSPRYKGLACADGRGKGHWTGEILTHEDKLLEPYRKKKGKKIFVCDMSDLFYEKVPFEFIDKVFAVMACSPQHTFQVLTKRTQRMADYIASLHDGGGRERMKSAADSLGLKRNWDIEALPFRNVWLGTSVENQTTANERLPVLAKIPAAVRFVSFEPLLEPIILPASITACGGIHLGIIGGESEQGRACRECDIHWIRGLLSQLHRAGAAVFVKQLGSQAVRYSWNDQKKEFLRLPDKKGGSMAEWPEDLRVRELPKGEGP